MSYILNTPDDRRAMLEAIGVSGIEELFAQIPNDARLNRELHLPPALSELELMQHMSALADKNRPAGQMACFLGGGSYDHFIPSVVGYVASRGEFYTSYTPYQPEASQGNLQAFFEYQTLICQLTGMDVSNASLYDGGSAAAEAVLMAMHATRRERKVVTAASVHPEYRQIVGTYLVDLGAELVTVGTPGGTVSAEKIAAAVDDETACVLIQQPNFFGCVEEMEALAKATHERGALLVVAFDPISLGLLKRPGDYGADIAIAEGQSLGTPMQFGGPYLGIMACREQFVRRMPGASQGKPSIAAGNAAGCSRCKRANSISAARRQQATSARTRDCSRCVRQCIWLRWARTGCERRRTPACKNLAMHNSDWSSPAG